MSSIALLMRLQILEAVGGFKASIEKRTGMSGRVSVILTVILGIIIAGATGWLGYMAFGLLGLMEQGKTFFTATFLATGSLTFVFALPAVLGTFFGSSDINNLLPLPISTTAIAFSKALSALAASYVWTALFMMGPLAGWGIASGAGPAYWIAYVAAIVLVPCLPTAYAGILSILLARVFRRLRRRDTITTMATVISLVMSIGFYLVFSRLGGGDALASSLGRLSGSLSSALMAFPAYGFAVQALATGDVASIALFAAISLAAFGLFVLVARIVYLRIVTSLSAGGAASRTYEGELSAQASSPMGSLVRAEFAKVVRSSQVFLNFVVYPVVATPILMAVMMGSGSLSDLSGEFNNPEYGRLITAIIIALVAFLGLVDASTNRLGATAISREGSNWIHMKYLPVPLADQLRAKAMVAFCVSALAMLVMVGMSGIYFVVVAKADVLPFVCTFAYLLGACWLIQCLGVLSDARRPHVDWGNDGEIDVKVLRGGGGLLRGLLVAVLYLAVMMLPMVLPIDLAFQYPAIAAVGIAAGVLVGNASLKAAARRLQAFE